MSLCIASAGSIMTLLAGSFSLSWTHSVEKTTWMERWQVEGDRLALVIWVADVCDPALEGDAQRIPDTAAQ